MVLDTHSFDACLNIIGVKTIDKLATALGVEPSELVKTG
jgi:hypothetical protein